MRGAFSRLVTVAGVARERGDSVMIARRRHECKFAPGWAATRYVPRHSYIISHMVRIVKVSVEKTTQTYRNLQVQKCTSVFAKGQAHGSKPRPR
jgi:hypothetical protein